MKIICPLKKIKNKLMYNLLKTIYPENQLKVVNTTKETGDILLTRINKPVIIIENKYYTMRKNLFKLLILDNYIV